MAKTLSIAPSRIWVNSVDPTVSETLIEVGNWWRNSSTNDLFACHDATDGQQIWKKYPITTGLTTFTPTLAGTAVAGAATYSTQLGRYTQIGNLVTCWINLTWSATTGAGNALITGLPVSANAAITPTCSFTFSNITLGVGGLSLIGQISGTQIAVSNLITAAGLLALVLPSAGTLQTSFTYSA